MIQVAVNELQPGMVVGYPILSEDGSILLAEGVKLTISYIGKLRELGFERIYVDHQEFRDLIIDEPIAADTRMKVQRILFDSVKRLQRGNHVSYGSVAGALEELMNEIMEFPGTVFYLVQIRNKNDILFHHSISVAVFSLLIGRFMNLSKIQLKKLGLGSILHDVGKIRLPRDVLYKQDLYNEQDKQVMRMHSLWSKEIIQKQPKSDFLASMIALQHHERMDGSGYPYGLVEEDIHFLARICACADVYDALTVDRPYRKRFSYAESLEYLMGNAGRMFDVQVVTTMVRHIAPYPVGETVRLSNGEVAVVVRLNEGLPIRPMVRVLQDREGRTLEKPRDMDLTRELTVSIICFATEQYEDFNKQDILGRFNEDIFLD